MTLPANIVDRLILIRALYLKGADESRQPYPQCAFAILTLHDAVELLFVLAVDHLGPSVRANIPFLEYFDVVNREIAPNQLQHKPSMIRLNDARRGLKHSGIIPGPEEIERVRNSAADFFEDNTPLIFGVSLSAVSLVDLVKNERARNLLRDAQQHMSAGDAEKAIVAITRAHRALWQEVKPRGLSDLRSAFNSSHASPQDRHLGERIRVIYEALVRLDSSVEKMMFGIDPIRSHVFESKTPGIFESPWSEKYQVAWAPTGSAPSIVDCHWCLDYVVGVALRIQRAALPQS